MTEFSQDNWKASRWRRYYVILSTVDPQKKKEKKLDDKIWRDFLSCHSKTVKIRLVVVNQQWHHLYELNNQTQPRITKL